MPLEWLLLAEGLLINGFDCSTMYVVQACNLFFIFIIIVCSICTDPGLVPNSDCNGCVVTDICLADNPCVNGNCTLNSASNDYTCDCAPGFTGINCDIIGNGNATCAYLLVWPGAHEECVTSIYPHTSGKITFSMG